MIRRSFLYDCFHLKQEHYFPGPVIDRANSSRWREEGRHTLWERAHAEVERRLREAPPSPLDVPSDPGLPVVTGQVA